jgi:hypothetical protein
MKYFIAGKEVHSDKNLEKGLLQNYTELGFECVYSHLLAKRFINDGTLNAKTDVVVTCQGREFFYDNYIKTITWDKFYEISTKYDITFTINASDFFVDGILQETSYFHNMYMEGSKPLSEIYNPNLTSEQNHFLYVKNGIPKYKYFEEDFNLITNLNFNKNLVIPNEKFICLNRRYRMHREELNMPVEYTEKLIQELKQEFNNVKIFITGYHNESFEKIDGVKWVSLRDWCTLINNDNCMAIIQNQTGTANLSQLCGKFNLLNIILDMELAHFNNPLYFKGRRPDVLGKAVNFKKLKNIILKQLAPIKTIIETIKNHA